MAVPRATVDLCKKWESFARVVTLRPIPMAGPYLCPAVAGKQGYGRTRRNGRAVRQDDAPITEPEALGLLLDELHGNVSSVLRLCPVLTTEPECRLAAVTSFVYNLGAGRLQASTLRRKIN